MSLSALILTMGLLGTEKLPPLPPAPKSQTGYDLSGLAAVDAIKTAHEKANLPTLIIRRPYGGLNREVIAKHGLAGRFINPLPDGFSRDTAFLNRWLQNGENRGSDNPLADAMAISFNVLETANAPSLNRAQSLTLTDTLVMSELRNIAVASNRYNVIDSDKSDDARFSFGFYYGIKGVELNARRTSGDNELTDLAEVIVRKTDRSDGQVRKHIFDILRSFKTEKGDKVVVVVINLWLEEGERLLVASHGVGAASAENYKIKHVPGHTSVQYKSDNFLQDAIHNALQDAINNLAPIQQ